MYSPRDVAQLAEQFWARRRFISIIFLGALVGAIGYSFSRPRLYRAESYIDTSLPTGYEIIVSPNKLLLGFPELLRGAYQKHASALADPSWAEAVLASGIGPQAAGVGTTVKARTLRSDAPGLFRLAVSVDSSDKELVARAADLLARSYASEHSLWEKPELNAALAAIDRVLTQLDAKFADSESQQLKQAQLNAAKGWDPHLFLALSARATCAQAMSEEAAVARDGVARRAADLLRQAGLKEKDAQALSSTVLGSSLPAPLEAEIAADAKARIGCVLRESEGEGRSAPSAAGSGLVLGADPRVRQKLKKLVGDTQTARLDFARLASLWQEARGLNQQRDLCARLATDYRKQLQNYIVSQQGLSRVLKARESLLSERSELEKSAAQLEWARQHGELHPTLWVPDSLRPTITPVGRNPVHQLVYALVLAALAALGVGTALIALAPSPPQAGKGGPA